MTYNVDRKELTDLIYEATGTLGATSAGRLADQILQKYDVTEKPEPVGTISVDYTNPRDRVVSIKVAEYVWVRLFFGELYAKDLDQHVVYTDSAPWSEGGEVYRP
ncbi:hypothetical protein [Mycolicibacterium houstonense]|uniref:hypothetical protein n=1 Tax=Mycolicibacterium houstonense TaxID=146021 RepID=UPI00083057EC|nr:hypothetical protein [Mycolicibacterium houstonense]